jgi:hypothetical protein
VTLIPSNSTVVVETKFTPPLTVNVSGAAGGPPGLVTRLLKPKVSVLVAGNTLASVAPAGEPYPNHWPTVRIVVAIGAALAVYGALRLGLKVALPLAVGAAGLSAAKILK